jgi:autotransporter-associated beta strand protein
VPNSNFGVELNRSGTPGGNVTLLTFGAGSNVNTTNFYLANATDYTAALSTTATTVSVGSYAAQTALTTMYWMGNKLAAGSVAGVDNAWALSNGTVSNWSTSDGTYAATALTPGATANVIFSNTLSGRAQQSTVLASDVTVNSLVIADSNAVTIAGANGAALTLMSSLSTAGLVDGTPGSAITITSTANATSTISSRVNLSSNQTWNVASGKTLVVGGEVAGGFSLTKADAGTVILNGVNTYSGNTTISAGTLQIGTNATANGAVLGGGNYAGNIVNNGTLSFQTNANQIVSGIISGSGNLTKAYSGTLTLSGANTYTGKTSITPIGSSDSGALIVSSFNSVNGGTPLMASSSLGAPTTVANGTIDFGSTATQRNATLTYIGGGETTDRVINYLFNGNNVSRTLDASGSGLLKFTSTFTRAAGSNNNNIVLQGSGSGEIVGGLNFVFQNFTKAGAGTWTLGGNIGHTGTTTISGGTLELNSGATIGGGTYSNTITFSNSSALRYNSTASQTLGGVISGAGSIVKDNTGTLTLSNVNTYTGATTVNAGTLIVGVAGVGSTAAGSAVTVASGGTLGGTGTVNGAITVTGSIAPGNSGIGILNSGAVTWNGNATSSAATDWKFNLGDTDTADKLVITGNFTKGTGSAFWFDFLGSAFTGTFDLVTWSGSTNFSAGDFEYTNLGGGYTGSFTISGSTLQFIAIPEPSTALGGLLLAAGLFRRRRR